MSINTMDSESWIGSTLVDNDDRKLGTIEAIYFDEQTGQSQWMAIKSGLFGNKHHFVPLAGATPTDEAVITPYDKSQIDDAPNIDPDEDLADDQVVELYRYYGLAYDPPPCGDQVVGEPDPVLTATAPRTQAEVDMLVATEQMEPGAGYAATDREIEADQDRYTDTGQDTRYRAA